MGQPGSTKLSADHRRSPGERNLALDGLRGLAVLLVTISHAGLPILKLGGAVGVTLFFVLSGYLITSLILAEKSRTGRVSLRAFYVRRALRLLPALVVALIGGSLLAIAFGQDPLETLRGAGLTLLYLNNLRDIFDVRVAPFSNLWSLSLEEQYYLLWPVALMLLARIRPRVAIGAILLFTGISLWLRFAGPIDTAQGYHEASYLPHTNAWALLLGSALPLWLDMRDRPPRVSEGLAWGALAALIAAASLLGMRTGLRETAEPVTYVVRLAAGPVAAVCAVILITYLVTNSETWAWLSRPRMLFFGSISYALYLWHGIFDHVFSHALGATGVRGLLVGSASALMAVGVAVMSFRLVETPFLRMKRRFEHPKTPTEVTAFASG